MKTSDFSWKGHVALLAANIIWGLNAPIGKEALAAVSATAVTAYRMLGACFAFWILSLFLPHEHVTRRDKVMLLFAALFGIVFNQGMFIYGLSLTSPVDASIITSMPPIITMILSAIFLREPITWKKVIGTVLGVSGALILIFGNSSSHGGVSSGNALGDLLCLLAQVSFCIYLTLFKGLISRYSPVTVSKWLFLYASICFLPFSYNEILAVDYLSLPFSIYWRLAFVVFGATFLSYLFMTTGQHLLRPTIISMYNYAQPVVATIVSVALGLSVFSFSIGVAVLLIFSGVYFVTQSKSRAQLDAELAAQSHSRNKNI
ncbi:MAG TPA: EamA family transporter [Candidatus Caccoplasma merdavium]|nr:EamA family transporter [Candidatus Caccoplasma merdavium]